MKMKMDSFWEETKKDIPNGNKTKKKVIEEIQRWGYQKDGQKEENRVGEGETICTIHLYKSNPFPSQLRIEMYKEEWTNLIMH